CESSIHRSLNTYHSLPLRSMLPAPCFAHTRTAARRASGLYRFYLPLIADFWGRILVRSHHAPWHGRKHTANNSISGIKRIIRSPSDSLPCRPERSHSRLHFAIPFRSRFRCTSFCSKPRGSHSPLPSLRHYLFSLDASHFTPGLRTLSATLAICPCLSVRIP